MKATLTLALVLLITLSGCHELQTSSRVQMKGDIEGQVNGKVRTEVPAVMDYGPVVEVPVGPSGGACKTAGCAGESDAAAAQCKIAVIDVDGVLSNSNHSGPYSIGENPVAVFKEKLDAAAADANVKGVVVRINTPGGGVAASDLMWHELQRFRTACHKPVVACLLDLGCGGGYYLATACDAIVALPSGVVGGLGVLLNLYEAKEGMALISVFDNTVRSGPKADMGSPVRTLSAEERTILRGMAESYHERLKDVVLKARPRVQRDANFFDGRVMTGQQAVDAGLVDAVGYLDDAVRAANNLSRPQPPAGPAGGPEPCEVVMYRRRGDAARSLYATTPNRPIHPSVLPLSIPGIERSKLPLFLYMWQVEPTLMRLNGI